RPGTRAGVPAGRLVALAGPRAGSVGFGCGMGGPAAVLGGGGGDPRAYGVLVTLAFVLSLAMLSVGFLISVLTRRASVATGVALFVWLGLAFLSDLGLMGGTVAFRLHVSDLFALAVLNPLQVFKMAVLGSVHATLDVLGPAGTYAIQAFGPRLPWLFAGALAAWVLVPLGTAGIVFGKRGSP
ncbi:MAG: ABC transporter permease, partial [Gemmatimonadetes bacterium]|nr:ABC transporter permease [Gemmatimonadota bacterium]